MNGTENRDGLPWVDMAYAAGDKPVAISQTKRAVSDIARLRRDLERRLQTAINAELNAFIDATGMAVDSLTVNILRPGSIEATRQIGRIQSIVLDISVRR
ncbi:hypothetical protein [Massilia sp. CCM 8734]|uniref:hypothetical protein n=1 Tax=Massilia sp. CCM 8734 TaxID=2609283 RepID=UPI00141F79A6|nr:hypothetical protein [Massilia sp. CCM 8734]NHZ94569.1 hypothetical protein [Massilia sp. CCM 8734]